jgi:hypothetical protein
VYCCYYCLAIRTSRLTYKRSIIYNYPITIYPNLNIYRYHINSERLFELGWREQVSWEDGLKTTFEWYRRNSVRFGDIEAALVAHPRAGLEPHGSATF